MPKHFKSEMINIHFIEAERSHLEAIVSLLFDDELGKTRELTNGAGLTDGYSRAFNEIASDPNAKLIVGLDDAQVIACAQLNFLTYLTYEGGVRSQIEGVRVHRDYRGQGIGEALFKKLITLSKERGCHMVQLTTNKKRKDAYAFYEKLGFLATHEGFKFII